MGKDIFMKKTAVIGAGLLGGQVAVVLSMGSQEVSLVARRQESLDKCMRDIKRYAEDLYRFDLLRGLIPEEVVGKIKCTLSLDEGAKGAEIVVESISEDLEMKKELFKNLDELTSKDVPLASNTSSLPITKLAERTKNPERVIGSHFIQPGHIVPAVEVVKGERTSDSIVNHTANIWRRIGKTPLIVKMDLPGFLVNRLQHAIAKEGFDLVARGAASPEDVDIAVAVALAPRFTVSGPLEQRDLNGLDTVIKIAGNLWRTLSGWEEPYKYLKSLVDAGNLGLKSGKGIYDWSGKDPLAVRKEKDELLIKRLIDLQKK